MINRKKQGTVQRWHHYWVYKYLKDKKKKEYFEQAYVNKISNLDEMGKFLITWFTKTHSRTKRQPEYLSIKDFEFVVKNLSINKTSGLNGFTGPRNSTKHLRKK